MIVETDHKVKSVIEDVDKFEKGQIWEDFSALVNGRILAASQNLCNPEMTETIEKVRYWQAVRDTALRLGDLPEILREEIRLQKEQKEEVDNG